ncbi:hypothetical protein EOT10_36895 [Streptomyces antnestii]|uniref:Uncharacterized protein n=1 Tax=Streptomyces antnestii TaxID=2494256 RepID=A0A3S2V883_9ACTN|nr:hypothetical protein EOT10_36895 [Streptomyces sp. San01]
MRLSGSDAVAVWSDTFIPPGSRPPQPPVPPAGRPGQSLGEERLLKVLRFDLARDVRHLHEHLQILMFGSGRPLPFLSQLPVCGI